MIKKRIRGQDVSQNIGEEVILLGKIGMMSPNAKYIELVTTDDTKINVTLPEPIDGNIQGYMEVYGTVQSKATLLASSFAHFSPEMTANFSAENYNELLMLHNLLGDKKWRFSADTNQPF